MLEIGGIAKIADRGHYQLFVLIPYSPDEPDISCADNMILL